MSNSTQTSNLIEALKINGFEYVGVSAEGLLTFNGKLIPRGIASEHRCEVLLDRHLKVLPRIRLLDIPEYLPKIVPHLGYDGELCYLAKDSIVLDIFDPVGQSLACIKQAAEVLGHILRGEMTDDLEEEFFSYWIGPPCVIDFENNSLGKHYGILAKNERGTLIAISDSKERVLKKISTMGYKQHIDKTLQAYRVKTAVNPRPLTRAWPPATVKEILEWQQELDPKCRNKIRQRILEGLRQNQDTLILVDSPSMSYSFIAYCSQRAHLQQQRHTSILGVLPRLKVQPLLTLRVDDNHIAQRNIPTLRTLARKELVIIGCGTIGGYLADMLVKAGAGSTGGRLTLVDYEILYPHNIGRHRLGLPHVFSNKAIVLTEELKRLAPGANIRALTKDARDVHLGSPDLLIDASGEEALGHWLCKKYIANTPMLSVWIEGPGTAVRGLLRASNSNACFRCLWHHNRKYQYSSVIGPLPSLMTGRGCEGAYVPFPASASVHAASLGTEMILDWANDVYSPALRTRVIDYNYQLATPDCDPPRDPECQACNL